MLNTTIREGNYMKLRYLTVNITAGAIVGLAIAATPTPGPTLGSAIKPQVTPPWPAR